MILRTFSDTNHAGLKDALAALGVGFEEESFDTIVLSDPTTVEIPAFRGILGMYGAEIEE